MLTRWPTADILIGYFLCNLCCRRQVLIRPASKVVIKFLQLMMKHGYIGEFEFVDDHRAGKIVVELNGRCGGLYAVLQLCSWQDCYASSKHRSGAVLMLGRRLAASLWLLINKQEVMQECLQLDTGAMFQLPLVAREVYAGLAGTFCLHDSSSK